MWLTFACAVLASVGVWYAYHALKSKDKYSSLLFILYVLVWIILGINVKYRHDWIMENILTVPFVALIYATHRRFKLSNLSYSLIFAFMMLHTIGSHYTYSEVPFGVWVQNFLGLARNHYDRIIHFGFGFLLAYPVREVGVRLGNFVGFWGYYIPFELTLAFSAIYEIIEWAVAVLFGGDLGVAYLGTQGDVWDAQKDMAMAGVGALLAMAITATVIVTLRPKEFFRKLHESLRVKHREVLGERALQAMMRKR
ncbi:DUF2238 domain-containing protein [Candidatus Woesearchaeota archaeon]|nr:DUF2238 domain-containing protein [Candidatus Woesearchaeota archaeon]